MVQQKEISRSSLEFSPQQKSFYDKFFFTVGKLEFLENSRSQIKPKTFEEFKIRLYQYVNIKELPEPEQDLIYGVLDLFALKHGIGSQKILLEQLSQKPAGKMIGFIGPLGVAKTVMAKSLCHDLNVEQATVEPYDKNPFWEASQEDSEKNYDQFMLRSQIYYLISNIRADIGTRLNSKMNISDTSTLTDILMWAEWYHQTGHFSNEEYQVYRSLVDILKPIIPRPDLIVALKPDTIENLKEGIRQRALAEPIRRGELMFAQPNNQALSVLVNLIDEIVEEIGKEWNVPTLKFIINPLAAYKDPAVRYDIIYQIREKMGMLGHFLKPPPKEVAKKVIHLLSKSDQKQVVLIHSKSMFSGKTTAECIIAETLGVENVLAFQPQASIRKNEKGFEDQETSVISRDGLKINALTIKDNNLSSIKKYLLENKVDPQEKPYIFIDEVMLFNHNSENPSEAVCILEDLRQMGFHLILDGIDYTFQGEPFTFMFQLLRETKKQPKTWCQIETSTRCRYCNRRATGTRLWLVNPDGTKTVAPYNYDWKHPGSMNFEPVCDCPEHQSCVDRPQGFVKPKLPTD